MLIHTGHCPYYSTSGLCLTIAFTDPVLPSLLTPNPLADNSQTAVILVISTPTSDLRSSRWFTRTKLFVYLA